MENHVEIQNYAKKKLATNLVNLLKSKKKQNRIEQNKSPLVIFLQHLFLGLLPFRLYENKKQKKQMIYNDDCWHILRNIRWYCLFNLFSFFLITNFFAIKICNSLSFPFPRHASRFYSKIKFLLQDKDILSSISFSNIFVHISFYIVQLTLFLLGRKKDYWPPKKLQNFWPTFSCIRVSEHE